MDLLPGCKPLGTKWIFTRKLKIDGSVDKYKARLVVQDFHQKKGIDYFDTYSPETRMTSIRKILVIAALRKLEVDLMGKNGLFKWRFT